MNVDVIKKNEGKQTVIICPVGPIWHYPIFAEKVNAAERRHFRLSKNPGLPLEGRWPGVAGSEGWNLKV